MALERKRGYFITAPAKWNKIKRRLEVKWLIIAGFLLEKAVARISCVCFSTGVPAEAGDRGQAQCLDRVQ